MDASLDASLRGLSDNPPPRNSQRCWRQRIEVVLTEDENTALDIALDDARLSAPLLSQTLAAHGHRIGAGGISKHRRGGCACSVAPTDA